MYRAAPIQKQSSPVRRRHESTTLAIGVQNYVYPRSKIYLHFPYASSNSSVLDMYPLRLRYMAKLFVSKGFVSRGEDRWIMSWGVVCLSIGYMPGPRLTKPQTLGQSFDCMVLFSSLTIDRTDFLAIYF